MRTLPLLLALGLLPDAHGQALLYELRSPNEEEGGHFGIDVSGVPDLDGDGVADLLVGARHDDPGTSPSEAGRAYVFSGATGELLYELRSPNEESGGWFGFAVSGVGDVDGDGRGDLLIGALFEDPGTSPTDAGRAYVFSGAAGELLHTLASPNEEGGGRFGQVVKRVEDLDGDEVADLLVGAYNEDPGSSPTDAGRAYVFSGSSGALLYELASPNEENTGEFGSALSGVGDVDGDGVTDLLVGAGGEGDGICCIGRGRAYVFSGASGALLYELRSPNQEGNGQFGARVSGVGDVDGDGRGDLLISAPFEGPGASPSSAGRAYVFSGASGALLHTLQSPHEEADGLFGLPVSGVEDLDGDGVADVLVGAGYEDPSPSPTDAGRAYVFSGVTGALLYELASPHEEEGGYFGLEGAGVGDVDGDGRGDVLVGAYGEGPGTSPNGAGRVYLFSGGIVALTVAVAPNRLPVVIPPEGGHFVYEVTLTNTSGTAQEEELWIEVTTPSGAVLTVRGPVTVAVPPASSVLRRGEQRVPARAEGGTSTYAVKVGTFGGAVLDSDAFTFEKEGAALAGRADDDEAAWKETAEPLAHASAAGGVPEAFALHAPSPNPSSGRTTLGYDLPEASRVRLAVYDMLGREVARLVDGELPAGRNEAFFDGSHLPSGTYLVRMEAGGEVRTRPVTLVR